MAATTYIQWGRSLWHVKATTAITGKAMTHCGKSVSGKARETNESPSRGSVCYMCHSGEVRANSDN